MKLAAILLLSFFLSALASGRPQLDFGDEGGFQLLDMIITELLKIQGHWWKFYLSVISTNERH
jgi:hypothetical protein